MPTNPAAHSQADPSYLVHAIYVHRHKHLRHVILNFGTGFELRWDRRPVDSDRGRLHVVKSDDLSNLLPDGVASVAVVVGQNGSGKSTLIDLVAQIIGHGLTSGSHDVSGVLLWSASTTGRHHFADLKLSGPRLTTASSFLPQDRFVDETIPEIIRIPGGSEAIDSAMPFAPQSHHSGLRNEMPIASIPSSLLFLFGPEERKKQWGVYEVPSADDKNLLVDLRTPSICNIDVQQWLNQEMIPNADQLPISFFEYQAHWQAETLRIVDFLEGWQSFASAAKPHGSDFAHDTVLEDIHRIGWIGIGPISLITHQKHFRKLLPKWLENIAELYGDTNVANHRELTCTASIFWGVLAWFVNTLPTGKSDEKERQEWRSKKFDNLRKDFPLPAEVGSSLDKLSDWFSKAILVLFKVAGTINTEAVGRSTPATLSNALSAS